MHATFAESSPNGSHTLPLALRLVLPLVAQPVARQWRGTVDSVGAHNLPTPTMTAQGATHRRAMAHAPSIRTFPHQQTENAPRNHHVVSILHGGAHRLQHRLPRISKPKTGCATTSLCPSSTVAPTALNTDLPPPASRKRATQPTRCVRRSVNKAGGARPAAGHVPPDGADEGAYRPESFTDEVSVERSMGRARHTIARSLCAHESFVGIIHVMSMVDVR